MKSRLVLIAACALLGFSSAANLSAAELSGTFIQLSRDDAKKSTADWAASLDRMQKLGVDTLVIQWTAQEPVLFLEYTTNQIPRFSEQLPVLERLFDAARGRKLSILLGLQNDPGYWTEVTGSDRILRDYFLIRVSQNEKIQQALLEKFGDEPSWKGYYIPEEIDDLTWRKPGKRHFMQDYLSLMCRRLRTNDADRAVAVSAFFRGRTAPDIVAQNLLDLVRPAGLDVLLIQDGVGVGDPPSEYVPLYYQQLQAVWAGAKGPRPALWGVIELFKQTSREDKPFAATPAAPARVRQQIKSAAPYFEKLVAFTLPDYADPDRGKAAARLFKSLRGAN